MRIQLMWIILFAFTYGTHAQVLKCDYKENSNLVYIHPEFDMSYFERMPYCDKLPYYLDYGYFRDIFVNEIGKQILTEEEREDVRNMERTIRVTVWMNTKGKILHLGMNTSKDVFEKLGMRKFQELYAATVNRQYDMRKLFTGDKEAVNKELSKENGYIIIHTRLIGKTE